MSSSLLAIAEGRWRQVRAEQPTLGPALDLQGRLLSRQIELTERLSPAPGSDSFPPPDEVYVVLAGGEPAFARVSVDTARRSVGDAVAQAFGEVLGALDTTAGRQAATRIGAAAAAGGFAVSALLAAALRRQQEPARIMAASSGLNLPVLWFAAEVATAPLAHAWQTHLLGVEPPDERLREAVESWDRGSCPACGSWPALAEFFHGERLNRCAYCAAVWPLSTDRCTYCGTADERFRTIVPDRERPGRRLELCRACGGYLKTLDVGGPSPFPLVAIEDLASSDLDRAALHHGFRRMPFDERA